MELVSTIEISGEEREIADAYAREQIDGINSNLYVQARFIGDASIVFNQLISAKDNETVNGTAFSFSNGIATITGAAVSNGGRNTSVTNKYVNIINGHKYLFYAPSTVTWVSTVNDYSDYDILKDSNITKKLFTATKDVKNAIIGYNVETGKEYNTSGKFELFDLTKMFGAGNEPTIEQFESMFPNDYYPYTESTPISNYGIYNTLNDSLSDIKMLGWSVPKECPIQNKASGNQFIQKVGRVDLGSLSWEYNDITNFEHTLPCFFLPNDSFKTFKQGGKLFCKKYSVEGAWTIFTYEKDKVICNNSKYSTLKDLIIRDSDYTDVETFKNAMQGEYLYYELAEEILIKVDGNEAVAKLKNDLSDSLPVGTILTVEADTPMSSDMWRFLNTGKMTYQNGGALVEMGTMIYQKIK